MPFYSGKSEADKREWRPLTTAASTQLLNETRRAFFFVLRRTMSSGTALSCDGQKTISTSISIKALFSWCYPVACWTFKRFFFFFFLYIWFGFSSFARRIRSVAISNGSFFYSFLVRKRNIFIFSGEESSQRQFLRVTNAGWNTASFLIFFPFFFIFMEMKKACAHLIQSCYSSDVWGGKKGDTNTKFNGTPGQFLLLVSVNGFFNQLKFRVFAMQLFQLGWTWKFK